MVEKTSKKQNKTSQRSQDIFNLAIVIVSVFMLSYISSFVFFRIDLTSDKRYSLSKSTKKVVRNLEDRVYFRIYLDGDLPIGFIKLKKATKELLDEMNSYGRNKIEYTFVNPYESNDQQIRKELFNELYELGLQPTNIQIKTNEGETTQKLIFPGAIISYNGVEIPINLLQNNPGLPAEINLNNSIQALEYKFTSQIKNLTNPELEKIAFLEGHGELNEFQVGDISKELANFYQVDRGIIGGRAGILDNYKAVIIAKPTQRFPEEDKFVLDQYIMNGGKVLWFIDEVNVSLDSLVNGMTIAFINEHNLSDQLFKYGVRINPVLVRDIQSNLIPINTAVAGAQPKFTPVPWLYFPLLNPSNAHPITKNLNLIKSEFTNYLDTLNVENIKKSVLISTSKYTNTLTVPASISLSEVNNNPDRKQFNQSDLPVAVLLEGNFSSVFKNRLLSQFNLPDTFTFKETSVKNSMLVVADGDIIRNDVKYSAKGAMISPLGFDSYTNQSFGNKEFILNAINYLADDEGLLDLRAREFKLRLLDKTKIKEEKTKWQVINTLLPVILVILFGYIFNTLRKRKYQ